MDSNRSAGGTTAVVVAGGDRPHPGAAALVPRAAYLVAADRGVDHARSLGLRIDVAVGDFDSISSAGLESLTAAGTPVERHPAAKDATDFALAVDVALRQRPTRLLVIGDAGGRLDHLLGLLGVLGGAACARIETTAVLGRALVAVVGPTRVLAGHAGAVVSLIPLSGDVSGVTTTGLRWPLAAATLGLESSLGISNEFTGERATVTVETGTLLVVQPDALPPTTDDPTEDA